MIKWVSAALGLVVSMAVGAGLAAAHDKAEKPSVTDETIAERDDAELEGTLEILHEDREDGSSVYHQFLSTHDGKRFSLEGVHQPDLLTGDLVRVRGTRSGQKLQLLTKTSEALQVLQYAPISNTFGPQKIAVFLVNFANNPSHQAFTTSSHQLYVNSKIIPFFVENSYGQTSIEADVFGWYTMPFSNVGVGCPAASIQYYANQAAVAAGINLSGYTRRVYYFPPTAACGWSGMASIGGNPSSAWLNGDVAPYIHELGHTFGLWHSHSMKCPPAVLGPNCQTFEYGDVTDMMGALGGHFNPFQKARLGWLDYGVSPPITTVTTSGTYTIDTYHVPGTTPKALKIQRGTTAQAFFVRLSRPVSFDRLSGVFVYVATDGAADSSSLLDMTPEMSGGFVGEGLLDVGKSFTDSAFGITIKTVSVSSTGATIQVDMDGEEPSCTRSAPSVISSPVQSPAVQAGSMVTYNVSVTNTDSAGCSASTFTLQATTPTTSWQKSFGASSITTNPGATGSTTLRITSPSVPTGSYAIVSAATRTTASPLSGSGSAFYNVGPSCTRSAPSVTGSPVQSPGVQAGTMVTYNVSVTNTDSAGCAASTFTLQATVPTTSWQKSFGAPSVTTNPGATGSTTLRITSPSVPTGSYAIVSAATRTTASPLSGSGSVLYNVAPLCTRSAPSVIGSPVQSPAVQAGTMVTYNVSVTNTDSAGCSASTFTLQATAPTTSWQKSFSIASGNINAGASLSTTLRITSPAIPTGSYAIVSAATRTTASPLSGSGSVHYNVDSGGGPPAPPWTFTDNFDRSDSPVLDNSWLVMAGSLLIESGEARNQADNAFSLAVQPDLVGATQTVEARFASTNSNTAPRFGVVVRYGDLQNYYVCYRQLGGSSVVRIAKMQNGVETVLKSIGIANPVLNGFSTLSCQASGSTLTLRVDGVTKLSMTDGTFSTGRTGYTISTQKAGSHRADNFNVLIQ